MDISLRGLPYSARGFLLLQTGLAAISLFFIFFEALYLSPQQQRIALDRVNSEIATQLQLISPLTQKKISRLLTANSALNTVDRVEIIWQDQQWQFNHARNSTQQTDAQRRERERNIQLHLQLLRHAATCDSKSCHSANCSKMKGIFKHAASCPNRANGVCHICKRIWMLFQIHARQCKEANCKVPNCKTIREKLRQLTKQQQAMDDRRRQNMNNVCRVAGR